MDGLAAHAPRHGLAAHAPRHGLAAHAPRRTEVLSRCQGQRQSPCSPPIPPAHPHPHLAHPSQLGRTVVLFRDENGVPKCLDNVCPHRGAPLAGGWLKQVRREVPAAPTLIRGPAMAPPLPELPVQRLPAPGAPWAGGWPKQVRRAGGLVASLAPRPTQP